MATDKSIGISAFFIVLLASCGGGGEPQPDVVPSSPPPPAGVSATPADSQATVTWNAVAGATSYNVYSSSTSPVTKSATKATVATPGATLPALANGAPVFVAVTAANSGGESPLSTESCAVPTAAATAGLTLYDAFCAGTLDGSKWRSPLFSRGVVNGALALSVQVDNMAPATSIRGTTYMSRADVNAGGHRVTTLQSTLTVPAATASRTGNAELFAGLALTYLPPANRLSLPHGGALALLRIQVGLVESGNGLRASRRVYHCDNAACTSSSSSGIAFTDPAAFTSIGEAAAAYDTPYTVTISLDEATGMFHWTVAGGVFGAGVSGSADPATYVANDPSWAAIGGAAALAGNGFLDGQLRIRFLDNAPSGGSGGAMSARFDDVAVGFDNAAAAPWDDFSGAGGNSGPTELSAAKWGTLGSHSTTLASGSLVEHLQARSSATGGASYFQGHVISDPVGINTVQADFTVSSCANSAGAGNSASIEMQIYNDGTPGTTPPNDNEPASLVGDVRAYVFLDCISQKARFQLLRWNSTSPLTSTLLSDPTNNMVPMGPLPMIGRSHTLFMRWDATARRITFQVDGQAPVVVDPTTVNTLMKVAAPYVKAPNAPMVQIGGYLGMFSANQTASMDFRVNNVFTAQ